MFPAYGYNNAYPHGRTQMPTDHPNSEAFPPEMKLQKPNSPFMYESLPQHFGYPVPMPYHSCCNHTPYPGYYACRPPYPHFPSPQPHPQCHEAYSLYPEPYPFHYAPPPQYFPGWNYNMNVPRDFHCRECPHNKSHVGDKSVKIEEQESDAEKHDYVVPAGFSNPQRPIVWIPPDYLKQEGSPVGNKSPKNVQSASRDPNMQNGWFPLDLESIKRLLEDGGVKRSQDQRNRSALKLQEKKAEDDQKGSAFVGPQHELKSDGGVPNIWNGWMPLDFDNIKRLLQNEELKIDPGHQPSSQKHQMSSPVIWMPYDKEEKSQMGKEEDAGAASEASVQRPSNSHFIPVQQGDAQKQKTIPTIEAESDTKGPNLPENRGNVVKIIPVKQAEECADTKTKGKCDDSAKDIRNNKIFIDDGAKNKPVSLKKASKLPPVCLRVDPLPKKKNAKGSSRSPSPPGHRSERAESAKSQSSTSENNIDQAIRGPKDEAKKKIETLPPQKKDMDARKDETVENRQEVGIKPGEAHKPARKVLSAVEAAIIIQSAFRGYEVRKWEPLRKLKHIAAVREKAAEVRKSIKSAPGSMCLKQKVALGETLMKLLLDLDTIQGLHPSVREIRKSLASELVRLQERLDNLAVEQPNKSAEDPKTVQSIATLDKSSMSSALTGADGQQGGGASKLVCPEKERLTDSDGPGNSVLPEESLSNPSVQQIEPELKDEAANENPIQMCQADELSLVTEAVKTGTEEKLEKPDECESTIKPEAGDPAHEKNDSQTAGEAPQRMSQHEAKMALGVEELNNEELEAPEKVSGDEGLEAPEEESKGKELEAPEEVSRDEGLEAPEEESKGKELEAPEEVSKGKELEAPEEVSRDEGLEAPEEESKGKELEAPEEVSRDEGLEAPEEESKGKELEAPEELSKGKELEAPIAEHEKHEPRDPSEGDELKEQAAVFPASESAIGESCVNAIEPVIAGESACVVLGEEGQSESSPEIAPVVEPENNVKAKFEELEDNHPRDGSQAEEPTGNPVEYGTRRDEKMNEAEGINRPLNVLDDKATEGQGHEPSKSEEGEEPLLRADSQSECRSEAMQDEKMDEVESKNQRIMVEENEKMRDLVEKLIASGKQQQEVISNLNGKLKDLETKLAKQRRKKRRGRVQIPRSCKASKGSSNEVAVGLAS